MQVKIRVLLEMRPAMEGFAGIPQEVRLLFRGLCQLPRVTVEGLLQTSNRLLAKGVPEKLPVGFTPAMASNCYSSLIMSLAHISHKNPMDRAAHFFRKHMISACYP